MNNIPSVPNNMPSAEEQLKNPNVISTTPSDNISKAFEYQPIEELFESPLNDSDIIQVDQDYLDTLNSAGSIINKFTYGPTGSSKSLKPTLATPTYDPLAQQQPIDFSTKEGRLRAFDNPGLLADKYYPGGPEQPAIENPIYSSIRGTNFDRYYKHPKFAELGWHPYSDNESYYNANSNIYDDFSRMFGQFGSLAGTGFMSGYRSIADMFDGDFTAPDLQSAFEFSDAMRIGNSTREGMGSSVNNFMLNSAYTFGIIGSIAAEELALFGLAAAQGGLNPVSDAVLAQRTAVNTVRGTKAILNTFDVFRLGNATRNLVKNLNNIDNAKAFYDTIKAGGKFAGDFILPETMAAMKSLNTTKTAAQNLSNLGKIGVGFGGFYRDLRGINLALSEAKLEAGMVYNDQLANSMAILSKQNGGVPLNDADMKLANDDASKAAFRTLMFNAPAIWLSNKIVLGTALGGFNKSLGKVFNENLTEFSKRLIRTKPLLDASGKISKNVFEDAGEGLLGGMLPSAKRLKSFTVKGTTRAAAHGAIRYFAANLTEGVQELYQEAVSHGTKEYYSALREDPTSAGYDILSASIDSAIDSQKSAEGFEVFMSGFLMGGLVQGPQKLFFQGIPTVINRFAQPEQFKEYQKNKTEYITQLLKVHNEAWNKQADDPFAMFDPTKLNFMIQKQAAAEMQQSAFENDIFGFIDTKDFALFNQMHTIFRNNTSELFKDQLQGINNLTDSELAQAFPEMSKDVANGKLRKRITDTIGRIEQTKEIYEDSKDKFENPFDKSKYEKGTNEYKDESLKEIAYEHARYLYMFTRDGFKRAVERADAIYSELASEPVIGKIAANDLTVLLSTDSIEQEINLLMNEIAVAGDSAAEKKLIKEKTKRFQSLSAVKEILTDKDNLTIKGNFDRRKIKKLYKVFESYVNTLAEIKDDFVNKDALISALKKIVDYGELKDRAKTYDKAIEYLTNPERLTDIVNRSYDIFKSMFERNREAHEEGVKKYINNLEANALLNKLAEIGVYPNADQTIEFLKSGDSSVLKEFFTEKGVVSVQFDPKKYLEVMTLLNNYNKASQKETTEKEKEETEETEEKAKKTKKDEADIFDVLDANEIETKDVGITSKDENESPFAKEILKQLYKNYVAKTVADSKTPTQFMFWLGKSETKNYINALTALKLLWEKTIDGATVSEKGITVNNEEELNAAISTIVKNDLGLSQWIQDQKQNPDVRKILDAGKLTFDSLLLKSEKEEVAKTNTSGKTWFKKGPDVNIIKTKTLDQDGNAKYVYQIVDDLGKPLSQELLDAAGIRTDVFVKDGDAIKAFNKIIETKPDSSTFKFDDVEMYYGASVVDDTGKEYIVLGTPADVAKGGKLFLLPIEDSNIVGKQERNKRAVKLSKGEFKNKYKINELKFGQTIVPSNASKLNVNEFNALYPYRNEGEKRQDAQKRLDLIIANLTPEDIDSLEFVVSVNQNAGVEGGDLKIGEAEANPLVKSVSEKYTIGLRVSNETFNQKLNSLLESQGLLNSESSDNIIAYLPNNNIAIKDEDGNNVDIFNISPEILTKTFKINKDDVDNALENVKTNYAIQQIILQKITKEIKTEGETVIKLSSLSDIGIIFDGLFSNNTEQKNVKELAYSTANEKGDILILDNTKRDGKVSQTYISNLEEEEKEVLIEQALTALENQNLSAMSKALGRYVLFIKQPNGLVTLAQLKQKSLETEELTSMLRELFDRAVLTVQENVQVVDGKNEAKSNNYNFDWNSEFNKKIYIAAYPGNTITLDVNSWGQIVVKVFDKNEDKETGRIILNASNNAVFQSDPMSFFEAVKESFAENDKIKEAKIKFTPESFKVTFPRTADFNTIIEQTETTLDERVRFNNRIIFTADSSEIQALKDKPTINPTKPVSTDTLIEIASFMNAGLDLTPEQTEIYNKYLNQIEIERNRLKGVVTPEPIVNTADKLSADEFKMYKANNYQDLPLAIKKDIANKIANNEKLSPREKFIASNEFSGPLINAFAANIKIEKNDPSDKVITTKVDYKTELKIINDKIKNKKAELNKSAGSNKKYFNLLQTDEKYLDILKEKDDLIRESNRSIGYKLIDSEMLSQYDIERIETFIEWAKINLPSFISIQDIDTLKRKLAVNGLSVGAFVLNLNNIAGNVNVEGTIYTGVNSPFKYHEAFHAVFRTLLTDEEITEYLAVAKKEVKAKYGKGFEEALDKFKNSATQYQLMTRERLEQEFYEEYMADEFEKFKMNPKSTNTNSFIKSLFTRFIEWIKSIFSRYTKNELLSLYENIDSAKYRSRAINDNRFTKEIVSGVATTAYKLIPKNVITLDSGKIAYEYLDPKISETIISQIAAMYIQREDNQKDPYNPAKLLTETISDFIELYDPEADYNANVEDIDGLIDVFNAMLNYNSFIKEGVIQQLSVYNSQADEIEYDAEMFEDEQGLRGVGDWDKDQSLIGGFSSLAVGLRRYIGTTTLEETDMFGNTELRTGEKIIVPVNFGDVYNGLLKAVKNNTNPIKMLQKMLIFSETNNQTRAVVNRIIQDIGLTEEQIIEGVLPQSVKNPLFFTQIIKGFENFRVDYVFISRDPNTNKVITYSAANRDDARSQIDRWAQEFDLKFIKRIKSKSDKDNTLKFLRIAKDIFKGRSTITNKDLKEKANKLAEGMFNNLGLKISPGYFAYSIAKTIEKPTKYQIALVESEKELYTFGLDDLIQLEEHVNRDENIFLDSKNVGLKSRLIQMANANAAFDESVGNSVFKNPNGDFVYAHQLPTYHLQKVESLNDLNELERLKSESQFLFKNLLLNSPAFIQLSKEKKLSILRIAGSKTESINQNEDGLIESGGVNLLDNGKTYGDSTPVEFILNLINSYTYLYNTKSQTNTLVEWTDPVTGEVKKTPLAPVLIRVIEASNTGDMMALPVIKTVTKDSKGNTVITDEALNLFIADIETEFERIKKESNEETRTEELIEGYNASKGVRSNKGRAYKFIQDKNAILLSGQLTKVKEKAKIKSPLMNKSTVDNFFKGTQRILVRDTKVAASINLVDTDASGIITLTDNNEEKLFTITNRGPITITSENIADIIEELGDSISYTKTDDFKIKVKIGLNEFYVEDVKLKNFLEGKSQRVIFEINEYELSEDAETAEETYLDFKTRLEEIANDVEKADMSLEEALKELGFSMKDFKSYLNDKLMSEYKVFSNELNKIKANKKISKLIQDGFLNEVDNLTEKAENAMSQLNIIPNDLSYSLMQIFFNDWLNTQSINQILLGDHSIIYKDGVDEIKRAKMQNASGYSAAMNLTDEKSGILHPVKNISYFPFLDPKFKRKHSEGEGDQADAQLYLTPKALRYFLFGFGKLTPAQVELLNKIDKGETITSKEFFGSDSIRGYKELNAIFNSEKLVYGDGNTFLKMSAVMLTKELTSYKNEKGQWIAKPNKVELHNLRVKMESFEQEQFAKGNGTLAIAAPLSAAKMLKKNVQSFADITDINKSLTADNETVLDAAFMRLQLINPSNKLIITDPTQLKNLITSEQSNDLEVTLNNETYKLKDIREKYNNAQSNRVKLKYINRRNLIFNFDIDIAMDELHKSIKENQITANLSMFLRYATEGLKSSQSSTNILEFFSFDSSGNPKFDLNNPITINKFEQLFLAYFSKGVLSEKIPGHSAALMSDFGVKIYRRVYSVEKDENGQFVRDADGKLIPDKFEVIREKVYESLKEKPEIYSIDQLENEIPKEGIVIIDKLRGNLKEYNENGNYTTQRYSEMILPAHFKEVMDLIESTDSKIPDVIAKAFGLRIPSQDKHSAVNIKLVDFLPVFYGSTAVFSTDIIETSGADFDIDKVYMHIKEWYVNKYDKFVEYGASKNDTQKFDDYIHYVNKMVKKSDSIYNEALELYKLEGIDKLENSITDKELIKAYSYGFTDASINALLKLGLPVTLEKYITYKAKNGEPYEAAYNNELLDYKMLLLGNNGITDIQPGRTRPILYEPADLTPLTDEWEWIKKELPELAELANESGINVDNLYGKYKAFTNNKEGAASIGNVVLPNIYLNLLKEYNVNIQQSKAKGETLPQIRLNGHTFVNFGKNATGTITGNYEIVNGVENKTGTRRQYILSALITAMTDNAKERLAAKLGLNKDALGVVAVLTALGVPIRTSLLLINNPIIRDNYFTATNKESATDPGIYKLLNDIRKDIYIEFKDDLGSVAVSDELLAASIKEPSLLLQPGGMSSEEYNAEKASVDLAILTQFLHAHRLKTYLANMSSLMNLNSGFGKSFTELADSDKAFEELGLGLNDKEFSELKYKDFKVPVDIRPLFNDKSKLWQSTYYRIYNEFVNSLLPSAFLTRTKNFRDIYNTVLANLTDSDILLTAERKDKISTDILSFITIKAYMKKLESRSGMPPLTNDLIYPQSNLDNSITKTVEKLKMMYENEGKTNYFLQYYLYLNNASNESNKSGLNTLNANTYTQLNDSQKIRIQNGFMEIYGNFNTRYEALNILHYIMVKDGLQYGYNSILDAITPYTLDGYLSNISSVHFVLKNAQNTEAFKNIFGMNYNDLITYFTENYLESNGNNYLLKSISKPRVYAEKESSVLIAPTIDKTTLINNPKAAYVFGENAGKLGLVGQSAVRNLPNAFPLTYKKGLQRDKNNYYSNDELDVFVQLFDSEISSIKETEAEIYFPAKLMAAEDIVNMKKYGLDIYKYVRKRLMDEFNYDVEKSKQLESKSITKAQAANQAVLIVKNKDGNKLKVDIYNGIMPASKGDFKVNSLTTPYINPKKTDKFGSNLKSVGFNFDILKDDKKNAYFVDFPLILKVKGNEGELSTFYKLEKVFSSEAVNSNTLITTSKPIVRGQRAEYTEIKLKGSNQQTLIGFLFDTENFQRPDYETVRKFVNDKDSLETTNSEDYDDVYENLLEDFNYDFEPNVNAKASLLTSGNNKIEVNEEEIKVNGENIADVKSVPQVEETDNLVPADDKFESDFEITERKPVSINKLFGLKKTTGNNIETFWNSEIANNPENKAKLKEQNILSLEDLLNARNAGIYANDEAFIEQIKQCII